VPHVIYWTNKPQFKARISWTNKIYKEQQTPIDLCTAHPKQQTRIGPVDKNMTLRKHINKTSLLLLYKQLYTQTHHQYRQLISEQYISEHDSKYKLIHNTFNTSPSTRPADQYPTINTTKPVPSWPHLQTVNRTRVLNKNFIVSAEPIVFSGIFYYFNLFIQHRILPTLCFTIYLQRTFI